jgi:HKD family nuclease/SAM-dependent methyltransferase
VQAGARPRDRRGGGAGDAAAAERYESAASGVARYFSVAFPEGARVLDIGAGSGRDAAELVRRGFRVHAIEPSRALRELATERHDELRERVTVGHLPDAMPDLDMLGGPFDGILCSAVLQHLPRHALFDAVFGLAVMRRGCGSRTIVAMSLWRRAVLVPGIYDEIVTGRMRRDLDALPAALEPDVESLPEHADVATPVAALMREALDAALDELGDARDKTLAFADELLAVLGRHAPRTFAAAHEWQLSPSRLRAIVERPASGYERPLGSLHRSSLIANAEGEQLLDHLRSEFDSADRVDLLCAFVKLSGVEKLRAALERHCVARGRPLRVLTTTYMGASDQKAIERLASLPNTIVKVSYDVEVTRLHAKAWLFHRESGLSTGYVGSSNLSHAAQTDGLEWNVRVAESEQPAVVAQVRETFEQYWDDPHQFEPFDPRAPAWA